MTAVHRLLARKGHDQIHTPRDLRLHLASIDHGLPNSGLSWEQLNDVHDRDHAADPRP